MTSINYSEKIPNNVDLSGDRTLQRALEQWQPNFINWWDDMGPEGSTDMDVYLRTAVSVDPQGWAQFGHVKMHDYRWGIFMNPAEQDRKIHFGDHKGEAGGRGVHGSHHFTHALERHGARDGAGRFTVVHKRCGKRHVLHTGRHIAVRLGHEQLASFDGLLIPGPPGRVVVLGRGGAGGEERLVRPADGDDREAIGIAHVLAEALRIAVLDHLGGGLHGLRLGGHPLVDGERVAAGAGESPVAGAGSVCSGEVGARIHAAAGSASDRGSAAASGVTYLK